MNGTMVNVRQHNSTPPDPPTGSFGGRLNLLLSSEPATVPGNDWASQLPTLLAPMGVTAVVARSGAEATEVIRTTPVHLAIVDLGIPLECSADAQSGGGEGGRRVLELLSRLTSPPPTLIIKARRTKREDDRALHAALTAGAFAVLDRPVNLETVLRTMSRALAKHYANRWPDSNPDQSLHQ